MAETGERLPSLSARFLSSVQDGKVLRYHYEDESTPDKEGPSELSGTQEQKHGATPIQEPDIIPVRQTPLVPVETKTVDDIPLSSLQILKTLIARNLKKSIKDIPNHKSIKELCGGKLQSNP